MSIIINITMHVMLQHKRKTVSDYMYRCTAVLDKERTANQRFLSMSCHVMLLTPPSTCILLQFILKHVFFMDGFV